MTATEMKPGRTLPKVQTIDDHGKPSDFIAINPLTVIAVVPAKGDKSQSILHCITGQYKLAKDVQSVSDQLGEWLSHYR